MHKKKASLVPLINEEDLPSDDQQVVGSPMKSVNSASSPSLLLSGDSDTNQYFVSPQKLLTRRSQRIQTHLSEAKSLPEPGSEHGPGGRLDGLSPTSQSHDDACTLGSPVGTLSVQKSSGSHFRGGVKMCVDGRAASVSLTSESVFIKYDGNGSLASCCLGVGNEDIPFSEIVSAELKGQRKSKWLGYPFAENVYELHVYSFARAASKPSVWLPRTIVFSSPAEKLIESWKQGIDESLAKISDHRPKVLLVLINPFGGKKRASSVYDEVVAPVFTRAGIKASPMVTKCSGDAKETIANLSMLELEQLDGIVAVGGDGLFHEIVNALLEIRSRQGESSHVASKIRVGHIPAGSTDAVACTLNGTRSAFTAAMHVALGDGVPLDVLRIDSEEGKTEFAVSMASYGFMGDLMEASERVRWMGPVRYEIVGARMLAANRSYHARIEYLPAPEDHPSLSSRVCTSNCLICSQSSHSRLNSAKKSFSYHAKESLTRMPEEWKVVEGDFAGIMLVIMPCRSEKSSKGVAKYGHLSDGNIHLVMVKRCSRLQYLRFLMSLSSNGLEAGTSSEFVDVVHAVAVKITHSRNTEENSTWNIDGELMKSNGIVAETHRGVIQVFARGVEHI